MDRVWYSRQLGLGPYWQHRFAASSVLPEASPRASAGAIRAQLLWEGDPAKGVVLVPVEPDERLRRLLLAALAAAGWSGCAYVLNAQAELELPSLQDVPVLALGAVPFDVPIRWQGDAPQQLLISAAAKRDLWRALLQLAQ